MVQNRSNSVACISLIIICCVLFPSITGTLIDSGKNDTDSDVIRQLINETNNTGDMASRYFPVGERNRRLIPYATYYTAPIYNNDHANVFQVNRKPQATVKIQPRPNYSYNYRNIAPSPSVEAAPPKYRYIGAPDYAPVRSGSYDPYYVQHIPHGLQVNDISSGAENWKPNSIALPSVTPNRQNSDIRYSTTSQEPNYLTFRYSDLEKSKIPTVQAPTKSVTIEQPVTTRQNYYTTVQQPSSLTTYKSQFAEDSTPAAVVSTVAEQLNSVGATAQYHLSKDLPIKNNNHVLPVRKYPKPFVPERTTKKTLTTMTIMKSQEIEINPASGKQQTIVEDGNKLYREPHPSQPIYFEQYVAEAAKATTGQRPPSPINYLNGYELNKQLPNRITPDNIKESIQTLSYILGLLQKADSITNQPIYSNNVLETYKLPALELNRAPAAVPIINYNSYGDEGNYDDYRGESVDANEEGTPGKPGLDYPIYSIVPQTKFSCKEQRYKGFFADPDTNCQVWHYCDLNGGQASFLCPNGTIFSQAALTCDWWFNVKCSTTSQLYVLNERLYKYIIPARPSFPEDFSGPLVDRYLTEKFKEIELKRKYRIPNNSTATYEQLTNDTIKLTENSETKSSR